MLPSTVILDRDRKFATLRDKLYDLHDVQDVSVHAALKVAANLLINDDHMATSWSLTDHTTIDDNNAAIGHRLQAFASQGCPGVRFFASECDPTAGQTATRLLPLVLNHDSLGSIALTNVSGWML